MSGRTSRCKRFCWRPRYSTASAARCATPSPAVTTGNTRSRGWRGRTYWSFRWTTSGSGTVTITSSPSSCEVASSASGGERLAPLHLKASGWYEENGLVAEAVRHSLSAGDHERAARLVERGTAQTWYRGEVVTLLGWLRALPEEAMRSRPLLLVWYAATLMLAGRSKGVYSLLADAEDAIGEDGAEHEHLLATAAAVRSMYARFEGDPQGAIEHARRALALLPEDNLDPRPFAAISLAQAYEAAGELEAASVAFAEAGALGRRAGHDYVALSAMASRAHLQLARGRLREAGDVLSALGYAAERGAELLPAVGSVRIGMGELLYEWDDLDAAERHLTEGVELAGRTGDVEILMWGHIALSRVRQAQGDAEGALAAARGGQVAEAWRTTR